jgi:hypothetical protein
MQSPIKFASVAIDRCATTTEWVVDSGATSHCTGMEHNWLRYLARGEHEVIFADESTVSTVGIGDSADAAAW